MMHATGHIDGRVALQVAAYGVVHFTAACQFCSLPGVWPGSVVAIIERRIHLAASMEASDFTLFA
jgi:hypothetical protein